MEVSTVLSTAFESRSSAPRQNNVPRIVSSGAQRRGGISRHLTKPVRASIPIFSVRGAASQGRRQVRTAVVRANHAKALIAASLDLPHTAGNF